MKRFLVSNAVVILLLSSPLYPQTALWDEGVGSLYSNLKAYRIGDVVTVIIKEESIASSQAQTDTKIKNEASGGPGKGTLDFISLWGLTSENNYKGDAKTKRQGQLQARISAIIVEILPNGDYRIEGHREVNINGERERIRLSGIVRSRDIGPDNTVLSTYVAEAQIMYDGKGIIDSGHEPGILTKLLNWLL
jgi:flagellar L-ring protein precursor FlgH